MLYIDSSMTHLAIFSVASLLYNILHRVDDLWTSIWCA
jgi:hypothetical protein